MKFTPFPACDYAFYIRMFDGSVTVRIELINKHGALAKGLCNARLKALDKCETRKVREDGYGVEMCEEEYLWAMGRLGGGFMGCAAVEQMEGYYDGQMEIGRRYEPAVIGPMRSMQWSIMMSHPPFLKRAAQREEEIIELTFANALVGHKRKSSVEDLSQEYSSSAPPPLPHHQNGPPVNAPPGGGNGAEEHDTDGGRATTTVRRNPTRNVVSKFGRHRL